MVTLGWLSSPLNKWKIFVANRVSEIQSNRINEWRYIKSEENPADCASRGIMPSELEEHKLWWTGPKWLEENEQSWPRTPTEETDEEQRKMVVNCSALISIYNY